MYFVLRFFKRKLYCFISIFCRRASTTHLVRSGDESGHSTLLLEPEQGLTIQLVMDEFYATFAEELTSRRDHRRAFLKFTEEQQYWLSGKMRVIKPVLEAGDLLLWLSGVPHCSHAAGEQKIPRRGLFVTANLRRFANANALKKRWAKVQKGRLGTHNCRIASGVTSSSERCVRRSYAGDPVIRSMAGDIVDSRVFDAAFRDFCASIRVP